MADTSKDVFSLQSELGREALDATWNPEKYTANINNPLAKSLISAYSGMKAAQGISPFAGTAGDIQAALAGAAGGIQAQQQMAQQEMMMAPIETVSPAIVEAIPAAKGIPFAQFMQLKDVFSAMAKQQKPSISLGTASQLKKLRPELSDEEILSLDEPTASSYVRKFTGPSTDEIDAQPQLVTLANGMQAYKIKTRSGYRYQMVPGQIMTETDRTRLALVNQASSAADRIKQMLTTHKAQELILKAGHSWKKLSSFSDTEAQKLAKDMFLAADARARILTGAAINKDEMDLYFNNLISAVNTIEGNIYNIDKEKEFFDNYLKSLTFGKVTPEGMGVKAPTKSPKQPAKSGDALDVALGEMGL